MEGRVKELRRKWPYKGCRDIDVDYLSCVLNSVFNRWTGWINDVKSANDPILNQCVAYIYWILTQGKSWRYIQDPELWPNCDTRTLPKTTCHDAISLADVRTTPLIPTSHGEDILIIACVIINDFASNKIRFMNRISRKELSMVPNPLVVQFLNTTPPPKITVPPLTHVKCHEEKHATLHVSCRRPYTGGRTLTIKTSKRTKRRGPPDRRVQCRRQFLIKLVPMLYHEAFSDFWASMDKRKKTHIDVCEESDVLWLLHSLAQHNKGIFDIHPDTLAELISNCCDMFSLVDTNEMVVEELLDYILKHRIDSLHRVIGYLKGKRYVYFKSKKKATRIFIGSLVCSSQIFGHIHTLRYMATLLWQTNISHLYYNESIPTWSEIESALAEQTTKPLRVK